MKRKKNEILAAALFCVVFCVGFFPAAAGELDSYRERLTRLAERCTAESMPLEAAITRQRLWENPPYTFTMPRLPSRPQEALPADATEAQKRWFDELLTIQTEEAARLFDEALQTAKAGRGYEALQTAARALFVDPDNAALRERFGERLDDGVWRTEWAIRRRAAGEIDHPTFGYLPSEHIARYEAGERFYRNRWMKADEETRQRRRRNQPWTVETEHFRLSTTVSLEEGVRLGRLLEEFHRFWRLSFAPMTMTEKEAAALVSGRFEPKEKPHNVRVFLNREEYLAAATRIDPTATVSSGGYLPSASAIFIYMPEHPDDTPLETMLFHEATHQLFAESAVVRKNAPRGRGLTAGLKSNYWAMEGIAVYLETFRLLSDRCVVGGVESYRLVRAKERTDEPDGLVPLERFASLGKEGFQGDTHLPALYTEAAGVTHFLFHADDGAFRPAFLELLLRVYSNQDMPEDLARLTGKSFEDLDQLLRDYLRGAPFVEVNDSL